MKKELALPITILLLYAASVCLNFSFRQHLLPPRAEADIIQRIFGSLRVFVGDWAFMKAEEYHHRGLGFERALAYHEGESVLGEEEYHAGEHEDEHAHMPSRQGMGLYEKLYYAVKVTEDSHLKPAEEKEVLPWFYVEVAFNPHDIRGYVLGAYWLERVGKSNEGLKFLMKGNNNNPDSAQILGNIGELYFKEKNYEDAAAYFKKACALWLEAKGPNIVMTKYQESDRLDTFDLLASLYVMKGDYKNALKIYAELLKFGKNLAILEKISKIKREVR